MTATDVRTLMWCYSPLCRTAQQAIAFENHKKAGELIMSNQWFPKIEAFDGANKLAKQGAIGVVLFALMNLVGLLFAFYSSKSPVDQRAIDAEGMQDMVLGAFFVVPLLLFIAYRVYKGKGWLVAGLVLVWFIVEVGFKIAGGTTNVGWLFAYVALAAMMINGFRACWWLRKAEPHATQESSGIR
jgi:hypothetical protein